MREAHFFSFSFDGAVSFPKGRLSPLGRPFCDKVMKPWWGRFWMTGHSGKEGSPEFRLRVLRLVTPEQPRQAGARGESRSATLSPSRTSVLPEHQQCPRLKRPRGPPLGHLPPDTPATPAGTPAAHGGGPTDQPCRRAVQPWPGARGRPHHPCPNCRSVSNTGRYISLWASGYVLCGVDRLPATTFPVSFLCTNTTCDPTADPASHASSPFHQDA